MFRGWMSLELHTRRRILRTISLQICYTLKAWFGQDLSRRKMKTHSLVSFFFPKNLLFLTGLHFELCLGKSCSVARRFTGSRDLPCQPFWNSQPWRHEAHLSAQWHSDIILCSLSRNKCSPNHALFFSCAFAFCRSLDTNAFHTSFSVDGMNVPTQTSSAEAPSSSKGVRRWGWRYGGQIGVGEIFSSY